MKLINKNIHNLQMKISEAGFTLLHAQKYITSLPKINSMNYKIRRSFHSFPLTQDAQP